jgi:multisubunit Na+/H+ antiporter MnhG subunit
MYFTFPCPHPAFVHFTLIRFLVNHKWFRILEKESTVTAGLLLTNSIIQKASVTYLSFSVRPHLPTYYRCGCLLLYLITPNGTHVLGRATLDEGLGRRRDLNLTTQNTQNRQTFMPTAGFESCSP